MSNATGLTQRLHHLADVVMREAHHLTQTDLRLFGPGFGQPEAESLQTNVDLAERVDAFVARFGRLQDTLGAALLPRLLEALLEPTGSVLDNLNRAEKLGWVRSAGDWAALRLLRNRMVHEYVSDAAILADALNAAHAGVPDLVATASAMAARVQRLVAEKQTTPGTETND
jgi:hypothetical protein